ncbi:hypothetical protein BCUN_0475 [Bifidobacterium cuniculi]|uniref:Uncharacterized protein n=1 Tax=Bifidobacterium cuniculi TaxID=1688 RepID=A0A087B4M5_9BIFI|nr:hypothetical protein BCUN_0475 [Bifidobacterium cuniculi]
MVNNSKRSVKCGKLITDTSKCPRSPNSRKAPANTATKSSQNTTDCAPANAHSHAAAYKAHTTANITSELRAAAARAPPLQARTTYITPTHSSITSIEALNATGACNQPTVNVFAIYVAATIFAAVNPYSHHDHYAYLFT